MAESRAEMAEVRFRFGVFEADAATGELRRSGLRVKIHAQPFRILLLLLERPGTLVTREEICRELWPEETFVDFEQGLNSAINRLREALGDKAANPRFVETLARRGYRFVAPVERIAVSDAAAVAEDAKEPESRVESDGMNDALVEKGIGRWLSQPEDLPRSSHRVTLTLFVLLQVMYVSFYAGALANLREIGEIFAWLALPQTAMVVMIVTAALLIPVRAFMAFGAMFHAPGMRRKVLRMWPFVLPLDILWALAPFLLLHHIPFGLALACTTLLVYAPFAQRSLVLMGAADAR